MVTDKVSYRELYALSHLVADLSSLEEQFLGAAEGVCKVAPLMYYLSFGSLRVMYATI